MNTDKHTEKSISEADFRRLWSGLLHNQQRYAIAMLKSSSKKNAALSIGIEPDTVYRWPIEVEQCIEYMMLDAASAAKTILEEDAPKAAMTKVHGLDSPDERIKQDSASEILDRVIGKPTQRQEVGGIVDNPLVLRVSGFDDV